MKNKYLKFQNNGVTITLIIYGQMWVKIAELLKKTENIKHINSQEWVSNI